MNQLVNLLAAILSAICIMILHEIPKALVYRYKNPKRVLFKDILYLPQYIDPIGLIFCSITHAGFSKPFRYEFETKKRAVLIGFTGFMSLILYFFIGLLCYRILYTGVNIEHLLLSNQYKLKFTYWFLCYFTLNSLGMCIVNLFPISVFDMGLCIAGVSLSNFIALIRNDVFTKLLLYIILYLQSIPMFCQHFVNFILNFD